MWFFFVSMHHRVALQNEFALIYMDTYEHFWNVCVGNVNMENKMLMTIKCQHPVSTVHQFQLCLSSQHQLRKHIVHLSSSRCSLIQDVAVKQVSVKMWTQLSPISYTLASWVPFCPLDFLKAKNPSFLLQFWWLIRVSATKVWQVSLAVGGPTR